MSFGGSARLVARMVHHHQETWDSSIHLLTLDEHIGVRIPGGSQYPQLCGQPTLRGVHQNLMHSFSHIHLYDLHENTNKPDVSPDGSKDENVFDIQEGVSIILAIKTPNQQARADVNADLGDYGSTSTPSCPRTM